MSRGSFQTIIPLLSSARRKSSSGRIVVFQSLCAMFMSKLGKAFIFECYLLFVTTLVFVTTYVHLPPFFRKKISSTKYHDIVKFMIDTGIFKHSSRIFSIADVAILSVLSRCHMIEAILDLWTHIGLRIQSSKKILVGIHVSFLTAPLLSSALVASLDKHFSCLIVSRSVLFGHAVFGCPQ